MDSTKYTVKVNIQNCGIVKTGIRLKQGDSGMLLMLLVYNGNKLIFDTANLPQVVFNRPDGSTVVGKAKVINNQYAYEIVGNEIEIAGSVLCDVKIETGNNRESSCTFVIESVPDTIKNPVIDSDVYINSLKYIVDAIKALNIEKIDRQMNIIEEEMSTAIMSGVQTVESTEDGGENVYTFMDHAGHSTTITVRNGKTGAKGDTGATGPQGVKGDTGATGATGPQGAKGDTGAAGKSVTKATQTTSSTASGGKNVVTFYDSAGTAVGTATLYNGAQGAKGDTGATGPQGAKGDTGATGPQGVKGDTGATGATGPQGAKGDTGAAGKSVTKATQTTSSTASGGKNVVTFYDSAGTAVGTATLYNGAQGAKGDTGATGPQGAKGDTGAVGPQGVKGDTGATGATGPQGAKGDTGVAGKSVTKATQTTSSTASGGKNVVTFYDSAGTAVGTATLYNGAQGAKGDTGATGPQGAKGDTGAAGKSVTKATQTTSSTASGGKNVVTFYDSAGTAVGTATLYNGAQGAKGDKGDSVSIINNLASTLTSAALSAAMGKELKGQIDALGGNNIYWTTVGTASSAINTYNGYYVRHGQIVVYAATFWGSGYVSKSPRQIITGLPAPICHTALSCMVNAEGSEAHECYVDVNGSVYMKNVTGDLTFVAGCYLCTA